MRTSVKSFAFAEESKNMDFEKKNVTNVCVSRNPRLGVLTVAANRWQNISTSSESCNTRGHRL